MNSGHPTPITSHPDGCQCLRCAGLKLCPNCGCMKVDVDWCLACKRLTRLPHEWDEDACCIHCGHDGAEARHLSRFAGYELTSADRWCEARERAQRIPTPRSAS